MGEEGREQVTEGKWEGGGWRREQGKAGEGGIGGEMEGDGLGVRGPPHSSCPVSVPSSLMCLLQSIMD